MAPFSALTFTKLLNPESTEDESWRRKSQKADGIKRTEENPFKEGIK